MKRREELKMMMWLETAKKAAVPLLGATLLFSYVGASGVAAAKTPAAAAAAVEEAKQQQPKIKGSIFLGQAADAAPAQEKKMSTAKEDAPDPALAGKTKLGPAQAEAAALQACPGAQVVKTELGDENGYLVYQVELTAKTGESLDVKVDAGNGQVLTQEKDAAGEAEKEKPESEQPGAKADTDNVQVEQEGEFQN